MFVQYYRYGLWKVPVVLKYRQPVSARSVVPLVFVTSLGALLAAAPASRRARRLLAVESAAYAASALGFALVSVAARGEQVRLLPRVVALFPVLHVAHGLGGVHGWLRALGRFMRSKS